jgi:formamidopyrimidine-DNA glycosylase
MPELPEVEVVRRGLQEHVAGRTITAVRVRCADTRPDPPI